MSVKVINNVILVKKIVEKMLIDKLVEECRENIDEKELHSTELHSNKMIYNSTLNDYKKVCSSCTIYIAFFVMFFIISVCISSAFIHFHWYLKENILKQQSIECNSVEHINGKYQEN